MLLAVLPACRGCAGRRAAVPVQPVDPEAEFEAHVARPACAISETALNEFVRDVERNASRAPVAIAHKHFALVVGRGFRRSGLGNCR